MKQNKNKNITKITSGALVLLLASGCYIGNSNADSEKNINEVKNAIVDPSETKSEEHNSIAKALENLGANNKGIENTQETNKSNSELNTSNKNIAEKQAEETTKVVPIDSPEDSNNKDEEKQNNINKGNNKENPAESAGSQSSQPDKKVENQKDTEKTEDNSKSADNNQGNAVIKPSQSDKEEKKQKETKNENKDKATDKNNEKKESEDTTTNSKKENTETDTETNNSVQKNQNKPKSQTVPGQGDDQSSKKLKSEIAGEINNIKALVNDGTWSEESVKAAKTKITNLEAFLLKGDLKDKDLAEVKSALNDIQINVLKKKIVKETNVVKNDDKKVVSNEKSNKPSQKTVIKSNTDNVQTGVGSLSSVLLTLGSSSLALFAGKKRK